MKNEAPIAVSAALAVPAPAPIAATLGVAMVACIALPWLNPLAPGPSPAIVPGLISLACGGLLLAMSLVHPVRVRTIALAWLLAALLSSAMALLQYLGTNPVPSLINGTNAGEAFANLRQRNQFATLTNIGLAALLWSATGQRVGAQALARLLPFAGAALLACGNAASSSRTGLVQLALLVLMHWFWPSPRAAGRRSLLLFSCLAYATALLLLPRLLSLDPVNHGLLLRLSEGDALCSSRLTLWSNVLHLIAQRPWLGWGWGELDYAHYITLYPGPRFCDILDNAHNLPLHLAVELGIPVALASCLVGVGLVWRAKPWTDTRPARQLAWAVLTLILLHSMLEYPLWYGPFQMAALLSLWILLWPDSDRAHGVGQPRFASRAVVASLAAAMIAVVGFAGWDYQRVSQIYLAVESRMPGYRDNTLEKIRGSRLFANQVSFAELTITPLTSANAAQIHAMADALLHYSPESRVIEKLIESAVMLGLDDEARFHMLRYQAAFALDYARWSKGPAGN